MRRLSLVFLIFLAACTELTGVTIEPTNPAGAPDGEEALVVYVSDGDSLIVEIEGEEEKVRLIGINAPERDECFGPESREQLTGLILDETVTLVTDIETEDQYGRMLRYLYLGDSFINRDIVADGFAMARSYQPNTTQQAVISAAEDTARESGTGMWANDACAVASFMVIESLQADAPGPDDENLNGEWIKLENTGTDTVQLSGWSIRDAESVNRYSFPAGVLIHSGDTVRISTGCGDDTLQDLYWCSDTPIWNNRGDVAFLLDPDGKIADRYDY